MPSMHPNTLDKPVKYIHPDNLPDANHENLAQGLDAIVERSAEHGDVAQHIHAPMQALEHMPWVQSLVPGIEKLAAEYHVGNFVVVRETDAAIFESMPLYGRIGMHLLFYGKKQVRLLGTKTVEQVLVEQSIKQGKIYDSPSSTKSIPSFVATYAISTDELLEPDLNKYTTFNDFFCRKLRQDARSVHNADDPLGICSAADCRLTVYPTIELAKKFWIKGQNFDIPRLLNVNADSEKAAAYVDASLALFRLAPADYHRFHSPIDGVVGDIEFLPGQYYTVNPQAVNEPGFDVLTANRRSILYLKHTVTGLNVAFVAIGALLVGSINWTKGKEKGSSVKRGDELGYFAYGGSTVAVVFPKGVIEFDQDILIHSQKPIETLVKVGNSIGKTVIR